MSLGSQLSSFKPSVVAIASSFEPSVDATARVFILQDMIPRAIFKLRQQTNHEIRHFRFSFFFYCEGPGKCIVERNFCMHFTRSHQCPEESHIPPLFGYFSQPRFKHFRTYPDYSSRCAWNDTIPPSAMLTH